MSDDPRWLALADAILDGAPVDWDAVSGPASVDHASAESLRLLASVADAHRRQADPRTSWGPLELIEQVGSGAFGVVYRARDTALDRDVALKLIDRHPGPTAAAEGRLLARVRHPNVVTVYGAAEHDGRYGIWMEFVRGQTLAAVVAEHGPLSVNETVRAGMDICRALAAVHEAGLIHGDLKAQNVMREEGGRIVLMDFGTGRFVEDVTDGRLAGTPLYLAPEVLEGARADVCSDVYSLGVLLYHVLTADFPVEGANLSDVRAAHAAGRRVAIRTRRRDVPSSLANAIERAITPDRGARLDTAAALERTLAGAASTRRLWAITRWAAAAILVGLGTAAIARKEAATSKPLTFRPRDFVLIGAFENRTGSPALDGAVEAAVEHDFANSAFVNVVPQPRIQDALQLMAKPPNTRLQSDVAREVCLRDGGIKAYLVGRIERIAGGYDLSAFVMDPSDGRVVRSAEAQASDDAKLPSAIRELSNEKSQSINVRWATDEIQEASGNRRLIDRALEEGIPWAKVMTGARTFMYSETLARAAASIGNRAAAIHVLEQTAPVGARACAMMTQTGFFWMRDEKLLADLYREDGQIDKARAIERDLLARLAVADPDYPLLVELKRRVGK